MSVLVKNMEFPKNCYDCPFIRASVAGDFYCVAGDGIEEDLKKLYERRMSDCPLVEVKEPHGRLIDADELIQELASYHVGGLEAIKIYTGADRWESGLHTAWRAIDDADTVIEAEGREE